MNGSSQSAALRIGQERISSTALRDDMKQRGPLASRFHFLAKAVIAKAVSIASFKLCGRSASPVTIRLLIEAKETSFQRPKGRVIMCNTVNQSHEASNHQAI